MPSRLRVALFNLLLNIPRAAAEDANDLQQVNTYIHVDDESTVRCFCAFASTTNDGAFLFFSPSPCSLFPLPFGSPWTFCSCPTRRRHRCLRRARASSTARRLKCRRRLRRTSRCVDVSSHVCMCVNSDSLSLTCLFFSPLLFSSAFYAVVSQLTARLILF